MIERSRLRTAEAAGVAVPLVLLLVLGLTALGYGVLALATQQVRGARAALAADGARLLAIGARDGVVEALAGDSLWRAAPWSVEPVSAHRWGAAELQLHFERIAREWYLARARSRVRKGEPWWRAAWVVWSLDPTARVAHASAALVHGGSVALEGDGAVDGTGLWEEGPGVPVEACARLRAAADSVHRRGDLPAMAALLPEGGPRLGLLDLAQVLERLPAMAAGEISPAPVIMGGECDDRAADNWGSPLDPGGPCGGVWRSGGVQGDLVVRAGQAQGLVAVDGAFRLGAGAVFAGVVLARDSVVLEPGARLSGLTVVGGPVRVEDHARIEGRGCPAARALLAAPDLRRPLPAPATPLLRVR